MKSSSTVLKKCAFCAYQSIRSFNVFRHEERIHRPKNPKICCNRRFLTKGEFYGHVEEHHPHTRKGFVSRSKYKIIKSNLKAYKIKTELAKQKIEKRSHQIKSVPILERKRSIRIQQMKLKAISSGKSESVVPDVKSKKNLEESVQLDFRKSLKRKFEETTNECDDDKTTNAFDDDKTTNAFDDDNLENSKSFQTLPLKKRILKKLEGNVLPEPVVSVPLKPKSNERSQENLSSEVCVNIQLDPNIMWPQTQHRITEYLSDIKFELFKIF